MLAAGLLVCLCQPACLAEQLGIELPRGGPQAISQEDLRRDAWMISRAGSTPQAAAQVAQRLSQMRLLPAFGSAWTPDQGGVTVMCGRKDGVDPRPLVVLAQADPQLPAGALTWAVVISLAKGWDEAGQPARTHILCVSTALDAGLPVADYAALVTITGVGDAGLARGAAQPPALLTVGPKGKLATDLGTVDYRLLEPDVRQLLGWIDALP